MFHVNGEGFRLRGNAGFMWRGRGITGENRRLMGWGCARGRRFCGRAGSWEKMSEGF